MKIGVISIGNIAKSADLPTDALITYELCEAIISRLDISRLEHLTTT